MKGAAHRMNPGTEGEKRITHYSSGLAPFNEQEHPAVDMAQLQMNIRGEAA